MQGNDKKNIIKLKTVSSSTASFCEKSDFLALNDGLFSC